MKMAQKRFLQIFLQFYLVAKLSAAKDETWVYTIREENGTSCIAAVDQFGDIALQECNHDLDTMQWELEKVFGTRLPRTYIIRNRYSGMCLSLGDPYSDVNFSKEEETLVTLGDCNKASAGAVWRIRITRVRAERSRITQNYVHLINFRNKACLSSDLAVRPCINPKSSRWVMERGIPQEDDGSSHEEVPNSHASSDEPSNSTIDTEYSNYTSSNGQSNATIAAESSNSTSSDAGSNKQSSASTDTENNNSASSDSSTTEQSNETVANENSNSTSSDAGSNEQSNAIVATEESNSTSSDASTTEQSKETVAIEYSNPASYGEINNNSISGE